MTRKQKLWFAGLGGGAVAVGGTAAAIMLKKKITPAQMAYKGAKKILTAVNLAGPTATRLKGEAVAGAKAAYTSNPVVKEVNRVLWKTTGLRVIPREGQKAVKTPGRFAAAADAVKGLKQNAQRFYREVSKQGPRARLQRYKMNVAARRLKAGAVRQLPAAPKGAMDLRVTQATPGGVKFAQVVGATGQPKTPMMFDTANQGKLARNLRGLRPKGAKKISEANINRLLDQRRAMKVPGSVAPVSIGHYGGFTSNPAGLDAYAANPSKTGRGGRHFTADMAAKAQERTLKNAAAQMRANEQVRMEKKAQHRILTSQRKVVVSWLRGGYQSAKKQ